MIDAELNLSPRSIAAQRAGGHSCTADIPFTEAELAFLNRESRAIFNRMPFSGPGFECYDYGSDGRHHYGRSSTIQATKYICAQWAKQHPNGPRIGVGDISLPDGGDTPNHATHKEGVDVDFSVVTNNGKEEASTWKQSNYSQALTQAFVDLVWDNPVLKPTLIYFNDPKIKDVQYCEGHDNHIHVRFSVGENIRVADYSPDEGTLRLVDPYMKGDRVKSLQLGLAKAGLTVGTDSIFGKDTEAAVKQFQTQHGLEADGAAGANTLAKLAEVISASGASPAKPVQDGTHKDLTDAAASAQISGQVSVSAVSQYSPDEGTLRLMSPYMKGDRVKSLQIGLAKAGITLMPDSVFGKDTEAAVKQFQTQHKLGVDGVADENTLIKLVAVISL